MRVIKDLYSAKKRWWVFSPILCLLGTLLLGALLALCSCSAAPPVQAPIVVTRTVYLPWVFPPDLISVPADPPVKPWLMQSDAAHYIVDLKAVADDCRLIHAASVAAAATPPPAH